MLTFIGARETRIQKFFAVLAVFALSQFHALLCAEPCFSNVNK